MTLRAILLLALLPAAALASGGAEPAAEPAHGAPAAEAPPAPVPVTLPVGVNAFPDEIMERMRARLELLAEGGTQEPWPSHPLPGTPGP